MAKKIAVMKEGALLEALRSAGRFKKLADGWIKDTLLGIDWGPSSDRVMDFDAAEKYCAEKGGRLPERLELVTLIDDTKRNPAINPIFSDTKTDDWYWSSTEVVGIEGGAWIVGFNYGGVDNDYKYLGNYVRPVRASQ